MLLVYATVLAVLICMPGFAALWRADQSAVVPLRHETDLHSSRCVCRRGSGRGAQPEGT